MMMKPTIASSHLAVVVILLVLVAPAFAQGDESARFPQVIDAAPTLRLQRAALALNPPLLVSSPTVDRQISSVAVDSQGHV